MLGSMMRAKGKAWCRSAGVYAYVRRRLNQELKRRTRVVRIVPHREACLRLVTVRAWGALLGGRPGAFDEWPRGAPRAAWRDEVRSASIAGVPVRGRGPRSAMEGCMSAIDNRRRGDRAWVIRA